MIELATNIVLKNGGANNHAIGTNLPKSKDSVSAYDRIEARRSNSKKSPKQDSNGFTIEKHFSSSSTELARTMGSFHKILSYLESLPSESEGETDNGEHQFNLPSINHETKAIPSPSNQSLFEKEKINHSNDEQLEFAFTKGENKPPVEIKQHDFEVRQTVDLDERPNINLGANPTDFKIHNIITDEIIKAISNSNKDINITPINEPTAAKLVSHVRKLLATQPHALATSNESAPVKMFDKTV